MAWMLMEALKKLEEGELEIPKHTSYTEGELREIADHTEPFLQVITDGVFSGEDVAVLFGEQEGDFFTPVFDTFGQRAWLRRGKEIDVVLWDEGNGWYMILAIMPHSKSIYEWLKKPPE